jgi:membrane protease YdiL (CAAX protease family)
MPHDVAEKAERAGRYMLFFIHLVVATSVFYMMRHHSVSAPEVGLHLGRWKFQLSVGCIAGVSWVALSRTLLTLLYVATRSEPSRARHYLERGSALLWVPIFIVGAFAEEFWRAFCLFALTNTGHSVTWSVLLTATAFGAGHLKLGVARALGTAAFGVAAALLFVWLGSLMATYSAHFIVDLAGLYWVRRSQYDAGV